MSGQLAGKVAVVTGSGQGVGRGIAVLLAREGARVVTNDLRPRGGSTRVEFRASALGGAAPELDGELATEAAELVGDADSTAAAIVAEGGEALACYGDVSDPGQAAEVIRTAVDGFGRIDVLVNNAAGLGFGPFADVTPDDWRYQFAAKVDGTFHCMRHAVPHMIRQGSGRILNAASDAWTGIASLGPYSAANAAVVALTKSTAKELAEHGITVNAYCPQAASPGHLGFKATLKTMLGEERSAAMMASDRMRESEQAHGPAEDLTFLAYLASEHAAEVSGAVFSVTAGGTVALYSEPEHVSRIHKDGAAWTVDELVAEVPRTLLRDHRSVARRREF
ncbi:SDR family NAD(P)-dependent oxidoreductase [Blastococcus sp. SYSU D00813]